MALVNAQFSSPFLTIPQCTKGIRPAALPVTKQRLRPSLPKRSSSHIAPLTCKAASNGLLSHKGPEESEADLEGKVRRRDFPLDFVFGAGSSAYQVEGGARQDGKGQSIWDTFSHKYPEKIADGSNGDIACDSYNRYREDVERLKEAGMNAYRFSISWSRILPRGSLGGVNCLGIKYYNDLINEVIAKGMKPFVTIFHWDTPQALEDEYQSFLDRRIVDDFKEYARLCFREFGDRVKHWITFNEPYTFIQFGYDSGKLAPGRGSKSNCLGGDSAREPYIVGHNLLLAHAETVKLYRDHFQARQQGEVGITLNTHWFVPHSDSKQDVEAAERHLDFVYGWFLDPIVYGDYPFIMKALVKDRLPSFTEEEKSLLKGSYDFIGVNYYTSRYVYSLPISHNDVPRSCTLDSYVGETDTKDGKLIGEVSGSWVNLCPDGLLELLLYTKKKYNDPPIYITENGTCEKEATKLSPATPLYEKETASERNRIDIALKDKHRVVYYQTHLAKVQEALDLKVNVKGFFAWCLMDNYEWYSGYTSRFGLVYVDFHNYQQRYNKDSYKWFQRFLRGHSTEEVPNQQYQMSVTA